MILSVPVFRSTARSTIMIRPFSGNTEPSAMINSNSAPTFILPSAFMRWYIR